jgi:hypothetical protein
MARQPHSRVVALTARDEQRFADLNFGVHRTVVPMPVALDFCAADRDQSFWYSWRRASSRPIPLRAPATTAVDVMFMLVLSKFPVGDATINEATDCSSCLRGASSTEPAVLRRPDLHGDVVRAPTH